MNLRLRFALFLLLIGTVGFAAAEPKPVIIDYRVYAAPQEHAFPMMKELRSADANAALQRLNRMTIDGKATLAGIAKVHALSGVETDHSSGEDQRWPIEWSQPMMPGGFGWRSMAGQSAGDLVAPTTFEARELGSRIRVTAEIDREANRATLLLDAGLFRLDGWFRTPASFTAGAVALSYPQPRFASSRVATRVTIPLRRWTLLSAQTDAKKPGLILLHIIRATAPGANSPSADRQP